jgi:hypothetical protein
VSPPPPVVVPPVVAPPVSVPVVPTVGITRNGHGSVISEGAVMSTKVAVVAAVEGQTFDLVFTGKFGGADFVNSLLSTRPRSARAVRT